MPSQVLGKVSVTPKGDYSSAATYYALDIVGYECGSYLAMKEVTGVKPSNDQVNWMQLSGPGLPGEDGTNGATFIPSVSDDGVISWTNDGEKENPDPVNIMGPQGNAAGFGTVTATADNTSSETPSVDVQASGPDTAKNFTFAFTGLKGNPGDTPDIEIGTVTTLEPNQDATADITGTTPNLSLYLGIPKGQPGTSVSRIQRTSGNGAPGTTDTYTMYDSNDAPIGTFTVYNGQNGTGAGDFMADGSVPMTGNMDMNGNRVTEVGSPTADTDAANKAYVDQAVGGVQIATDPTPTQGSVNPVQSGGVYDALADKQDALSGTEGQLVGFNSAGEAIPVAKPSYTASDVGAIPAPSGGSAGQILTKTSDGVAWEDAPEGGVTSFNSRTGAVIPQSGDYTAEMVGARPSTWTPSAADVGAVPTTRTVNGKALSDNISLTADDVGAVPTSRKVNNKPLSSDVTLTAADVGAGAPATSTTITLTSSGWTGDSAPFSQQVACSMVAVDTEIVTIDPQINSSDEDANNEIINAWALLQRDPDQGAGTLTFYVKNKPTVNIPVKVGVS